VASPTQQAGGDRDVHAVGVDFLVSGDFLNERGERALFGAA
jgi:hypothetical protein